MALGYADESSDVEVTAYSKSMVTVLKRHDVASKTVGNDESPIVVREPKLFKMLTTVCLDNLMGTIPAHVICLTSLAQQVGFYFAKPFHH